MTFHKYHSLGNDFLLIEQSKNRPFDLDAKKLCDRNFGVGADGVLLLEANGPIINCRIINADGSDGELCLNGIRCAAHFFHHTKKYSKSFYIQMGETKIWCQVFGDEIETTIEYATYTGRKQVVVDDVSYDGHTVLAPNPHFVIFHEVNKEWLQSNGKKFESHTSFKNKTNVEFYSHEKLLVYERGCGITLACGSGALATLSVLKSLDLLPLQNWLEIRMLGGILHCYPKDNQVTLKAMAEKVCEGQGLSEKFYNSNNDANTMKEQVRKCKEISYR